MARIDKQLADLGVEVCLDCFRLTLKPFIDSDLRLPSNRSLLTLQLLLKAKLLVLELLLLLFNLSVLASQVFDLFFEAHVVIRLDLEFQLFDYFGLSFCHLVHVGVLLQFSLFDKLLKRLDLLEHVFMSGHKHSIQRHRVPLVRDHLVLILLRIKIRFKSLYGAGGDGESFLHLIDDILLRLFSAVVTRDRARRSDHALASQGRLVLPVNVVCDH